MVNRALKAVRRANVALLVLDMQQVGGRERREEDAPVCGCLSVVAFVSSFRPSCVAAPLSTAADRPQPVDKPKKKRVAFEFGVLSLVRGGVLDLVPRCRGSSSKTSSSPTESARTAARASSSPTSGTSCRRTRRPTSR